MKSNNGVKAGFVVAVVVAIILIGAFGIPAINLPSVWDVRTGIDIQGGISVTLEAADGYEPTQAQMNAAKVVIEKRLDAQNVYDRNVVVDPVGGRVLVEIPYRSQDNTSSSILASDFNAQKTVIDYIGRTANLTFRYYNPESVDDWGLHKMSEEILVDGANIENAGTEIQEGQQVVTLKFNAEGTKQFADATTRYVGQRIGIYMDEDLLVSPTVQNVITSGEAIITGNYTLQSANMLAAQIRSGTMPFKLEPSEMTQITPLLGAGALDITIRAGILSFIFIGIYMIAYYRLPGFIAMLALIGLVATTLVILSGAQITLTLPGIAGILLTIGMSIDANIIIAERIREEMRMGRTIRAAIDAGFKKAFPAILDANITTILAAIVLYILGSGPIKGFAVTLTMGVLLSFVSAITVSRIFIRAVSDTKIGRKTSMYGVKSAVQT